MGFSYLVVYEQSEEYLIHGMGKIGTKNGQNRQKLILVIFGLILFLSSFWGILGFLIALLWVGIPWLD